MTSSGISLIYTKGIHHGSMMLRGSWSLRIVNESVSFLTVETNKPFILALACMVIPTDVVLNVLCLNILSLLFG